MIQHRAACFVLNKSWNKHQRDSITDMFQELKWPSLQDRRKHARLILMYKIVNHLRILLQIVAGLPTLSPPSYSYYNLCHRPYNYYYTIFSLVYLVN